MQKVSILFTRPVKKTSLFLIQEGKIIVKTFPRWMQFVSVVLVFLCVFAFSRLVLTKAATPPNDAQPNALVCPSPPSNFDPLTASASELQYYGLPLRPQKNVSQWATLLKAAKHNVCDGTTDSGTTSQSRPSRTDSYSNSSNYWSGYFAQSSNFDFIQAEWTVPCYNSSHSPGNSRALTWVGIGGWYGNGYLWQGGTTEDSTNGYKFWWEDFPIQNLQIVNGITVHCHDVAYVEADYNYSYSNRDYVYLLDTTTGYYHYEIVSSFTPNQQSADWIDEREQCGSGNAYALADFNTVSWSDAQATTTTHQQDNIANYTNYRTTMFDFNNTTQLARPSSLNSDGQSFSDSWLANGTSYC